MAHDQEVIDVDNLCNVWGNARELRNLRNESDLLECENHRLINKVISTDRLNEDLRKRLFNHDTQGQELARQLGFPDLETAVKTVRSDYSWTVDGHADLLKCQTRTLQLEDTLARHVVATNEAQGLITDLNEQIKFLNQDLEILKADLDRVRQERTAARQEAEKQAEEAKHWRQELQTTLPEIQRLVVDLQRQNVVLPRSTTSAKETVLSMHDSDIQESSVPLPLTSGDATPDYKLLYNKLMEQYNALLETKNKVSSKYAEDLATWKRIKSWLFEKGIFPGSKLRINRRKVPSELFEGQDDSGDPLDVQKPGNGNVCQPTSEQESLTEPPSTSSLQILAEPSTHTAGNAVTNQSQLALTQESVTEPPSSLSAHQTPPKHTVFSSSTPKVLVLDSSSEKADSRQNARLPPDYLYRAYEDETDSDESEKEGCSQKKMKGSPIFSEAVQLNLKTSGVSTPSPRKRTSISNPIIIQRPNTEPTKVQKQRLTETPKRQPIRKTMSSILVPDTPLQQNLDTGRRHSSTPAESPYMCSNKGKRKATVMLQDGEDAAGSFHVHTTSPTMTKKKSMNLKRCKTGDFNYMQFKGRGRYSNASAYNRTINGEFEIDPKKNQGVKYQYDEVVREKAARRQMNAGDCECCRDYYDAVGPLPPRVQAPLWKSPSPYRRCKHGGQSNADKAQSSSTKSAVDEIEAHKEEISRHRHDWEPPATPPDFWKIGFPTTQEVRDINRRAEDMHARKFKRIDESISAVTSRYRRRT